MCAGFAVASAALAQTAAAGGSEGARRALVLQKLKLVEQLLDAPGARRSAESGDAATRESIDRARALLDEGRRIADTDFAGAENRADAALRLVAGATRGAGPKVGDDDLRRRNVEVREQTLVYRNAVAKALEPRGGSATSGALASLDRLIAQADADTAAARHADAQRSLARAYRAAVAALAEARAGETVTIELAFASPSEEYEYERRRYRSHELLVDTVVLERAPPAAARVAIDREVSLARGVRARADEQAAIAEHGAAIRLMEQAVGHLARALRAAGAPVF